MTLLRVVLDQNDKIMKHKMYNQFNWKYKQADPSAQIVYPLHSVKKVRRGRHSLSPHKFCIIQWPE